MLEKQIHYDAVPFAGAKAIQIIKSVSRGQRPPRLQVPYLSDEAWKLMQYCWSKDKSTRPAIEDIVERVMSWQTSRALRVIENLKGLCKPGNRTFLSLLPVYSHITQKVLMIYSRGRAWILEKASCSTHGVSYTAFRFVNPATPSANIVQICF